MNANLMHSLSELKFICFCQGRNYLFTLEINKTKEIVALWKYLKTLDKSLIFTLHQMK